MQTQTGTNAPDAELDIQIDWAAVFTGHTFIVLVFTVVAGLLRRHALAGVDFPAGNGALLLAAAEALAEIGRWSLVFEYNSGGFPFIVPPIAPALAATLSRWTGTPLLDGLRVWPATIGALSVPLFYGVSLRLLRSKLLSVTATVAFMLMPSVTIWTLTDDALARAVGLCLVLVTLLLAHPLIAERNENLLLPAGAALALTTLTKPGLGYFAMVTLLLWLVSFGRNHYSLLNALLMGLVAVAGVSVWLLPMVVIAGLEPFLSAAGTVFYPVADIITTGQIPLPVEEAQIMPLLGTLGALGFAVAVAKRRVFLPLWLLLIPLTQPRSAGVLTALPLALLAALAVHQLILPLILESGRQHYADGIPFLRFSASETLRHLNERLYRLPAALMLVGVLGYAVVALLVSTADIESRAVPAGQRAVMQTVIATGDETVRSVPPDARFLVVSSATRWEQDAVAAWFPALTGRENVLLVPGSAWEGAFNRRRGHYADLQACKDAPVTCLFQLEDAIQNVPAGNNDLPPAFTHIYIAPGVNASLAGYLRRSEQFNLLSSSGGVRLYERVLD